MEGHSVATERTKDMWDDLLDSTYSENILEIGHGVGTVAQICLDLGARVHSVDIGQYPETWLAWKSQTDPKFSYEHKDSLLCYPEAYRGYDMIIVDGGHASVNVISDIMLGVKAGIEWIVVDDYTNEFQNIIHTVDFFCNRGILKHCAEFEYDSTGGENTLVVLKNMVM